MKQKLDPLLVVVTLVVLLLVSLPFWMAWGAGGETHEFVGPLFNYYDGNSYLAKMRQGWRGEWQFHLPYTAEPGVGTYLFPFYILLGHLARLFGWPLAFTFHFFRLAAALLMLVMLYRFCRWVFGAAGGWRLAFVLAAVGSGLGWLAIPFGAMTSDFWVAEAYPFLSAYANVHFPFGLAAQLWLLMAPEKLSWRRAVVVLLVSAVAAAAAPFTPPVTLVALGGLLAWKVYSRQASRTDLIYLGLVLVGSAPVLSYYYFTSLAHPVLSVWNAQNQTPTPAWWDVLLSFSPALLLAFFGARPAWQSGEKSRLAVVWAGLCLLLVYVPFPLQRRFLGGLFVPLAILAAYALHEFLAARPRRRALVLAALFVFALPTNLAVLTAGFAGGLTLDERLYLSQSEVAAMAWLAEHTPSGSLVLAAPDTSLFIPGQTDARVLCGHPYETAHAEEIEAVVIDFFAGGTADFMESHQVDYLFYGPRERALGALPWLAEYAPVFVSGDVAVYQVGDE